MSASPSGYETVIGLEVHVQLKTASKVFAPAPSAFVRGENGELVFRADAAPNTRVDPVVLGLPGALPVLNVAAVEQSARFALLTEGRVPDASNWVRKNYFYPDSPKNYQISQFPHDAIALGGRVEIELPGPSRNIMGEHKYIALDHAHLEEDVGKLTHTSSGSLVDYNRAGTPLLEIVTAPDLRSADEAVAFLNALRMMLSQAGISDCDMEKGQMRCDVNVSIRPRGDTKLYTRTEMKNLNSVSSVKAGIEYEVARQIREVEAGRTISQETRGWNADEGRNYLLRSKENAEDYRYFPDPDLLPVRVAPERLAELEKSLPERPFERQRRYAEQWSLPYTVTSVLVPDPDLASFFEAAVAAHPKNPLGIANLLVNDLLGALAAAKMQIAEGKRLNELTSDFGFGDSTENGKLKTENEASALTFASFTARITPKHIAELVALIDSGTLSKQQAKEAVLPDMLATGQTADAIVAAKGLAQSNDTGEIEALIREVLALPTSAKPIAEFKAGNEKALNSLKGPVMKASKGKANPVVVDELVRKLIAIL